MASFLQGMTSSMLALMVLWVSVGCETSHTSSSSPSTSQIGENVREDTVFVYGVGSMTLDELFDRFMNERMYLNEVASYANAVLKTNVPGAVDSVFTYMQRHNHWGRSVTTQLAQSKDPAVGPWLRDNADRLGTSAWSGIGSALAHNGWRDSVMAHVLMEQLHQNADARSRIARAFVGMGTLHEVRTIVAINDTTSSKWLEWTAIAAQARFDVPDFNKTVRAALRDTSGLHLRELEGVELNQRHDFLPELRMTLSEYRNGAPDHHLINNLEELIAEFEDLKAQGVKPGAPLDYPNATRSDSTQADSTSSS